MTDLDRMLNEMGVIARPSPAPKPERPASQPAEWKGVWYRDGVIPN